MQAFGGSHEVTLAGEVSGIDDQSIPLPPATRVSVPETDALGEVWMSVEWNDSGVVERLHVQDDVSRSLNDLVVTIGPRSEVTAKSRHAGSNATLDRVSVFGPIGRTALSCLRPLGLSLQCLRRQRREPPIRWIANQRRPAIELPLDHQEGVTCCAGGVLVHFDVSQSGQERTVSAGVVTPPSFEEPVGSLLQLTDRSVRQKRSPFQ